MKSLVNEGVKVIDVYRRFFAAVQHWNDANVRGVPVNITASESLDNEWKNNLSPACGRDASVCGNCICNHSAGCYCKIPRTVFWNIKGSSWDASVSDVKQAIRSWLY